ncbi:precorrin-6x reductase [Lyngbya aestuarii BL J]|uniref:Precorrin-6x reductase n=1 Tax=Lyngbya aestuarii BL J TaxID=1348334 RepID=U7QHW1_9CYAN|nr:cobalt-precorrin-6A reductase [Lyngbya aestuarii]ERT06006.1 precorrin-6x reductase [Lyngbya aestuarii BL J]
MLTSKRKIWLIGGTSESATLANIITSAQIPCIVSVTTDSAKNLYDSESSSLKIWVGKLDNVQIYSFIQQQNIAAILDASHPYAVEISKLAIATSIQYHIPYLRYERPCYQAKDSQTIHLDSFKTLLTGDYLTQQRVMLTLGYRNLAPFKSWQERSTLFVRILPSEVSLKAALDAGFTPNHIIALRPPISPELEKALWKQWNISLVVTKASGVAGGEETKQKVASELGISLIIIDRPQLNYPQQTSDLDAAIDFCCNQFE